jgi:hypothetical protein
LQPKPRILNRRGPRFSLVLLLVFGISGSLDC